MNRMGGISERRPGKPSKKKFTDSYCISLVILNFLKHFAHCFKESFIQISRKHGKLRQLERGAAVKCSFIIIVL